MIATLRLGRRVVRLAELHDVDAVLAQCGADGRCRVGSTCLDLELDDPGKASSSWEAFLFLVVFLANPRPLEAWKYVTAPLWERVRSFDLVEVQLDRGLATEDRYQNLDLALLGVDFADGGGSVANGPSMTVTDSPTSKSTSMTAVTAAAAASTLSLAALVADCFWRRPAARGT